jgi:hypothetical protein
VVAYALADFAWKCICVVIADRHCCSMRERMLAFDANALGDQRLHRNSQTLGILKLDRYCRMNLRKGALLDNL